MSTTLFSRILLACLGAVVLSCLLGCSSTRPTVAAHAVRCNVSHSYHK